MGAEPITRHTIAPIAAIGCPLEGEGFHWLGLCILLGYHGNKGGGRAKLCVTTHSDSGVETSHMYVVLE